MPRKDRSFTGPDVVRITVKNLTEEEKIFVIQELCRGLNDLPTPEEEAIEDVKIEEFIFDLIESGRGLFELGLSIGDIIRTLIRRL